MRTPPRERARSQSNGAGHPVAAEPFRDVKRPPAPLRRAQSPKSAARGSPIPLRTPCRGRARSRLSSSSHFQRALAVSRTAAASRSQIGALHVAACPAVSLSELTRRGGRHLPYRRGFRVPPCASRGRLTIAAVAVPAPHRQAYTPRSFRRTRPQQTAMSRRCSEARKPLR